MSSSQNRSSQIQKSTLKGHRGPVLCLAHSGSSSTSHSTNNHKRKTRTNRHRKNGDRKNGSVDSTHSAGPCCLLSGSEDGTARLWDLRMGHRAVMCMIPPVGTEGGVREVTSVAFDPHTEGKRKDSSKDGTYPYNVYLSTERDVYSYDLRDGSSPILRDCTTCHTPYLDNRDEVNQISFSFCKNKNSSYWLAAADDAGAVRIVDSRLREKRDFGRTLRHSKEGGEAACVTSAVFRPPGSSNETGAGNYLASGGTDCTVHLWDVNRPREPSCSVKIARDDQSTINQVCNPPMVHSLSWSHSGKLLASGLGDGTVQLFRANNTNGSLKPLTRLRGVHTASVACVHFPKFEVENRFHADAEDRLLVTAGTDGAVLFWDLGVDCVTGKGGSNFNNVVDPATMFHESLISRNEDHEGGKEAVLFGIPHGHKPNWLASSGASAPVMPSSLFVADTTCDIAVYLLPRI